MVFRILFIFLLYSTVGGFRGSSFSVFSRQRTYCHGPAASVASVPKNAPIGGKIVVTGNEDSQIYELLNEQKIWTSIVCVSQNAQNTRRRFMSRAAKYSGLLDRLSFAEGNIFSRDDRKIIFHNSSAWLAFGVTFSKLVLFADIVDSLRNLQRVFFAVHDTTHSSASLMSTVSSICDRLKKSGVMFTAMRHGDVEFSEHGSDSYFIVNSTTPLESHTINNSILLQTAVELLRSNETAGKTCGLDAGNEMSLTYLTTLRSFGLSRHEEALKMFEGSFQQSQDLFLEEMNNGEEEEDEEEEDDDDDDDEYQDEKEEEEEEEEEEEGEEVKEEDEKAETDEQSEQKNSNAQQESDKFVSSKVVYFDEFESKYSYEETLILRTAWDHFKSKNLTSSTTVVDFFRDNLAKAQQIIERLHPEKSKRQSEEVSE